MKMCVLEDNKVCNGCGACNICDLDKNKICDNCGKCLNMPTEDYYEIPIDEIMNTKEN